MPIPELVNGGARLSPFEDFQARTLSALSGLWTKLLYMTEVRSADGSYRHWGHSRVHGESASQVALARAHSELYIALLRTPIRELVEEIKVTDGDSESRELVGKITTRNKQMIPDDLEGGSPRHFNSIVLAARLVYEMQQASSHSTA